MTQAALGNLLATLFVASLIACIYADAFTNWNPWTTFLHFWRNVFYGFVVVLVSLFVTPLSTLWGVLLAFVKAFAGV